MNNDEGMTEEHVQWLDSVKLQATGKYLFKCKERLFMFCFHTWPYKDRRSIFKSLNIFQSDQADDSSSLFTLKPHTPEEKEIKCNNIPPIMPHFPLPFINALLIKYCTFLHYAGFILSLNSCREGLDIRLLFTIRALASL